jgi:hypothetical protein
VRRGDGFEQLRFVVPRRANTPIDRPQGKSRVTEDRRGPTLAGATDQGLGAEARKPRRPAKLLRADRAAGEGPLSAAQGGMAGRVKRMAMTAVTVEHHFTAMHSKTKAGICLAGVLPMLLGMIYASYEVESSPPSWQLVALPPQTHQPDDPAAEVAFVEIPGPPYVVRNGVTITPPAGSLVLSGSAPTIGVT